MCTVAPFVLPGVVGVAPRAAPVLIVRKTTMATYVEGAPAAWYGYDDDDGDIETLLRDIDAVVRPPSPADLPMPPAAFLVLSRRYEDADRGIRSVRIPATGPAPVLVASVATPTTPVAVLRAPSSYGDDSATSAGSAAATISLKKQPQQCEYDADIDSTFRAMEKNPVERPSADYLWSTQAGKMTMVDRAELVAWMHHFSENHHLAPGALHRAVSYVDRFLSAKKIHGGAPNLRIIGAAAVFAAAKYEDRSTTKALDADDVAAGAECTKREVLEAERELVATLGYRLSGLTAYTFVDHLTRHINEGINGAAVKSLAHHLADLALLDFRCVGFLPSVVAASAIVLALNSAALWSEEIKLNGYALEDLTECMDAIYDMHEHQFSWPGCAQMMAGCVISYSLPPRWSTYVQESLGNGAAC